MTSTNQTKSLRRTDGCPSRLGPGHYKRIPISIEHAPVGYYVACPCCGFRCIVVLVDEFGTTEDEDGHLISTSKPIKCKACDVEGYILAGRLDRAA